MRLSYEKDSDESEVAIALMGATGTGKTSFINLVSGSNLQVGRGLYSCTSLVQIAEPFPLDDVSVTLIDTPGFDDTDKSDADVLKMIAAFLSITYENGKKLAGVIYLHRISDFRMGGISKRNFKMFKQLCGDTTLKNVAIVTNMWGEVSREIGEAREAQLATEDAFLKPALDKGAQLLRHDNTLESAQAILRRLVHNSPEALRIQCELVDEHRTIADTAAGGELNRELIVQIKRHEAAMRELQEDMKEALRMKDESITELREEKEKMHADLARIQTEFQKLSAGLDEEKDQMNRRLKEMEENARRDAEKVAAEYRKQIEELQTKLHESLDTSASERAALRDQLDSLNQRLIEVQRPRHGWFTRFIKWIL